MEKKKKNCVPILCPLNNMELLITRVVARPSPSDYYNFLVTVTALKRSPVILPVDDAQENSASK